MPDFVPLISEIVGPLGQSECCTDTHISRPPAFRSINSWDIKFLLILQCLGMSQKCRGLVMNEQQDLFLSWATPVQLHILLLKLGPVSKPVCDKR